MAGIKPAPATALRTDVGPESVTVSWTDNSRVETDYRIEIDRVPVTSWTADATVGADSEEHTITGLLNGEKYAVRVIAISANGETPDLGAPSPQAPGRYGSTQSGGATYGGTAGTTTSVRVLATRVITTGEYGGSEAGQSQYGGN